MASNGIATRVYMRNMTNMVPNGRAAVTPKYKASELRINTVKRNGTGKSNPARRMLLCCKSYIMQSLSVKKSKSNRDVFMELANQHYYPSSFNKLTVD